MKTLGLPLAISAAASLIFLVARPWATSDWPVIFKVLSIFLLALPGLRVNRLVGAGLAISSLGDLLLGIRRLGSLGVESLFLLGLGSFLVAHLLYIAAFFQRRSMVWWKPGLVRVAAVLAIVFAVGLLLMTLLPSLGGLLIPVVVYGVVLGCMGISAMLADLGTPIARFGALFFVSSDAMIAIVKFRGPFSDSDLLIWITYYLAQVLILLGFEYGQLPRDSAQIL